MEKLCRRAFIGVLGLLSYPLLAATVPVTPFADLARHAQYDHVKISGDGHYLAATTVVKGKPMLALVDLVNHKGTMLKPREGNQVVDFWWVNDHRVLYTEGTKVSGFERPFSTGEIFAVNGDGSGADILFGYRAGGPNKATHIQQPQAERASAELVDTLRNGDGNHVMIAVTSWESGADGAYTQLFVMDVNSGTKRPVGTAPLRNASFVVDNHGVARFAMGDDSHAYPVVYFRAGEGQQWETLFQGSSVRGVPVPVTFNRDDSQVYMWCDAKDAVGALCPWDVATRTMKEAVWTSDVANGQHLMRTLDGRDVVGVYAMPSTPSASAFVAGSDTMKAIGALTKALPGESIRIVSSTSDGSKAVALASSDMDPGTYYLWDKTTGKGEALLQRADWIKPTQMAAMQPVEFKARDGLVIHGYLSMPPGREEAKHVPLVVMVHGGPFGIRDDWSFDSTVQALATHGYAVLQVNFRGSGGYGEGFERAGYKEWGGRMQDDVTDATHWAIDQGIASAGRICIFGGSYGGYAALEGAVKEPDLYRCAIGYVGVYDLAKMYTDGDISDRVVGMSYLRGTLGTDPAMLAAHSPINQLDKLKASVMLVVGGQDKRVPPVQGESLHAALNKRGIAHEWLYKSDEGHGFYDEQNNAELYERVVQFLDRNIGAGGAGAAVAGAP
ncbi:alpha/beta hydrolase family protein [Dyella telluris]|uniref:S9 family peptidase n=1 Tax=Dyella telluris TaxID=2763498 RepID=A0A7G8Q145_9GAMM|nr:S9 family peptidase [Dyella telluris]QNK00503.1 S9 family peptidase [Dyella telluris]